MHTGLQGRLIGSEAKHVSIVIKQAWNIRNYRYVGDVSAIREKIEESGCVVICIQATKRASFDHKSIRSFCPKCFDNFAFSPSVGASGGTLVIWNSTVFIQWLFSLDIPDDELWLFMEDFNFTTTQEFSWSRYK
jgi:hypothetical protein